MRMTRRQKRRQAALVDFLQAALVATIMIGGAALFLWLCYHWFTVADCHNARQGLAFIERCEASEDCTLRAHDLRLKETYTRIKLQRCPID